jgi:hypothetical protein
MAEEWARYLGNERHVFASAETLPSREVEVWDFADPSLAPGDEEDQIRFFRSARDRLKGLVRGYLIGAEDERIDD